MDDGINNPSYPVKFTGRGGQYFKIWIVNILLTIITLYIYSAWAKIRTKRYFYGNTVVNDASFEYHAKPLQILVSRLVAAALLIAVTFGGSVNSIVPIVATVALFLILPWAMWRSTKFNMRMTSYRNVRFGFDGSVWPVYMYQFILPLALYIAGALGFFVIAYLELGTPLLVAWGMVTVVFYLLLGAYTHKALSAYFLNHYLYGKSRFKGDLSFGVFVKIYLQAFAIGIGAMAIIIALFIAIYLPADTGITEWIDNLLANAENMDEDAVGAIVINVFTVFYAYLFIVGYFVIALIRAKTRNHIFQHAILDDRVTFNSSTMSWGLFGVMFTNLLLLVITLGFARPFTQVRIAKYFANHTEVRAPVGLDNFVGEKRQEVSAFGDEIGDAFDMDMDVGF